MSALLRSLSLTPTRPTLCWNISCSCFHSSSTLQKGGPRTQPKKSKKSSARTRLVQDLNPRGRPGSFSRGKLEIAPRAGKRKVEKRSSSPPRLVQDPNSRGRPGPASRRKLEVTPRSSKSKVEKRSFSPPSRPSTLSSRKPSTSFGDVSLSSGPRSEELRRKALSPPAVAAIERDSAPHSGAGARDASELSSVPYERPRSRVDIDRRKARGAPPVVAIEREIAPHLGAGARDASELPSVPYERLRSRVDIDDTLIAPSSESQSEILKSLPNVFKTPPLLEGLVASLHDVLGRSSIPTPIQALSIKHIVSNLQIAIPDRVQERRWHQCLLASETGSGKSFAYMLPLLQDLKTTELNPFPEHLQGKRERAPLNPRSLILAPTHELSRQLASFAKSLSHSVKLRVISASRANTPNISSTRSASKMVQELDKIFGEGKAGSELELKGQMNAADRDPDVLVSTPMKLLEMIRGRYWREDPRLETLKRPEVGFEKVEWVVVDEADVLYDPDFRDFTQDLLAEISRQRGHPVSYGSISMPASPVRYPFHLVLTTATIPASLNTYLERFHPSMLRLASPNLHRLPRTLTRETVGQSGGNKNSDVEKRIRQVWAEDAAQSRDLSRIVVFCNRSTKVQELCAYLEKGGVKCAEITSTGEARKKGSNKHLAGFLKNSSPAATESAEVPRVLVTTSLLSRGLDFAPSVSHVFILDEPRNKVDFLHRAGRTARAGSKGTVVIFGKGTRSSDLDRDLKRVRL